MKVKFAMIYIAAGVAFLAVSLWLFLSGGKSAKATRAKYRLGGIMLTAWSMLSAASCTGGPPQVTCYEPAAPPEVMCYDVAIETDRISIEVKDYGGNKLKPGDVMIIGIQEPTTDSYRFYVHAGNTSDPVIQEFSFQISENNTNYYAFEQVLDPTDYRGIADIEVIAVYKTDGSEESRLVGIVSIEIVG